MTSEKNKNILIMTLHYTRTDQVIYII